MANKPTPADFSPTVPDFPSIGQYQPIYGKFDLTTYIQGSSDYEIMAFLVQCYNATLKGYSDVTQLSKDTVTAYNQLQTWVNTWFDNLDVKREVNEKLEQMRVSGELATIIASSESMIPAINNYFATEVGNTTLRNQTSEKIDEMASDGTLIDVVKGTGQINPAVAAYLNSTEGTHNLSNVTAIKIEQMANNGELGTIISETADIQNTTTEWLNNNVTPVGSTVVVDKSLTIEGAAADAKSTGIIKTDVNNLPEMKKVLDYTSFENGYFNVQGTFSYNAGLANAWMGHRKYLSVGNAKKIVFKHSYGSTVQFNLYKYTKDKTGKSLEQINVEPNINYYHDVGSGDYFYAVSINKDGASDFTPLNVKPIVSLIEYDCTATVSDSIIPNIPEITVSNYATVGEKGTEDYSDPATAYNGMSGNGYLIVEPMNYDCGEHGFEIRKLYIKGCAKELVKFENKSLVYPYASLGVRDECVVENIHFKAGNVSTAAKGAYALHIENNDTQGKTMIFRNCIFDSEFQSGVGVGLRKDMNLIFENCEFINRFAIGDSVNVKKPDDYTTSGALFFHGSIDRENLGTQHITCRNCTFKSEGASALRIEDIAGNLVVATFVNCNFYSKYYGAMNAIDIVGGAEIGYLCGSSVKLGKSSHGNNIPQLNAY